MVCVISNERFDVDHRQGRKGHMRQCLSEEQGDRNAERIRQASSDDGRYIFLLGSSAAPPVILPTVGLDLIPLPFIPSHSSSPCSLRSLITDRVADGNVMGIGR